MASATPVSFTDSTEKTDESTIPPAFQPNKSSKELEEDKKNLNTNIRTLLNQKMEVIAKVSKFNNQTSDIDKLDGRVNLANLDFSIKVNEYVLAITEFDLLKKVEEELVKIHSDPKNRDIFFKMNVWGQIQDTREKLKQTASSIKRKKGFKEAAIKELNESRAAFKRAKEAETKRESNDIVSVARENVSGQQATMAPTTSKSTVSVARENVGGQHYGTNYYGTNY